MEENSLRTACEELKNRLRAEEQVLLEALAQKEVSETALSRELEIFRLHRCSMVFGLLKDLRVSSHGRRAQQLFGNVAGHSFESLLLPEDRRGLFRRGVLCLFMFI